jgi:hypothetical protein
MTNKEPIIVNISSAFSPMFSPMRSADTSIVKPAIP